MFPYYIFQTSLVHKYQFKSKEPTAYLNPVLNAEGPAQIYIAKALSFFLVNVTNIHIILSQEKI